MNSLSPKDPSSEQRGGRSPPAAPSTPPKPAPAEIGGPKGPEPTRHGDWQYNGRCTDF
ncbi:MAG TPA: DUF1674 domain-containing protein [Stellaceae bacterium]|nr:DUF1674 domain-containing protein [Stellaceae bacterium]